MLLSRKRGREEKVAVAANCSAATTTKLTLLPEPLSHARQTGMRVKDKVAEFERSFLLNNVPKWRSKRRTSEWEDA